MIHKQSKLLLSISLRFEHAYFRGFSCKVPAASGLQRIAGRAISVKLHPQEVLAAKLSMQYACSKRSEIDSTLEVSIFSGHP